MTREHGDVLHSDIFHCLKCGRMAYEPHGTSPPPACCEQPMVLAVADVTREPRAGATTRSRTMSGQATADRSERGADLEEYALLAEAMELSRWSRSFPDTDVSRYEELAQRVEALAGAIADQFRSEEYNPERLREEERTLVSIFERLVADLRRGPTSFGGWAAVCDRLDTLTAAFRRHEELESDLLRPKASGSGP